MRALLLVALSGCSSLLGISDPTPATGDGGPDGMIDSAIDAPPPCAPAIALGSELSSDVGATGTGFAIGRYDNGLPEDIAIAVGTEVVILHGDRTGSFGGDGARIVIPTAAADVAVGDFDTDADDDFVMWTPGGSSIVVRRQNRANNPPVEAEQPLAGPFTNVGRVIVEQLDGGLRPDLLVHDDNGTRVHVSSGLTPGAFIPEATTVAPGADALILTRQIDDAQRADALFRNGGAIKLSLQTNAGFQPLTTIADDAASPGIAVGNFDHDTLRDVVVSTAMGLVLYRQVTGMPGTFQRHGVISPLMAAEPMLVGDLNADGHDDLVLANVAILQCAPPAAGGPGTFTQVEALTASRPAQLVDVTGDDKPDLVRLDGTTVKVRVQ